MVPKDFSPGDLVWAKMKGYPPWPAKIMEPPVELKSPGKAKKPQHYVFFFGSENHAWILDENISYHSEEMLSSVPKKKSSQFQVAIDTILQESKLQPKKEKQPKSENNMEIVPFSVKSSTPLKVKPPFMNNVHKKKIIDESKASKKFDRVKKLVPKSSTKLVPRKPKKRPSDSKSSDSGLSPYSKVKKTNSDDYSAFLGSVPSNVYPSTSSLYNRQPMQSPGILERPPYVERPPTPTLDVETIFEVLKMKHVNATDKRIGFLGLGNIGRGIVKNLLNSNHKVSLWNRTPEKCDVFVKLGANKCQTPADVVACSDIVFCCVSDSHAAKALVFGNCGVLKGMEQGLEQDPQETKGYVEMTSLDPDTSNEICEAIALKHGRYLEAHVNGSRKQAEEGTLFILAAGNRSLFMECNTCFHAMCKEIFYFDRRPTRGSIMSIIVSMMHGVMYAALAECMALVDRLKLSQEDFIEILEMSTLSCPALIDKGRAILNKDFTTNTALKHVHKDLDLALQLGARWDLYMPITDTAAKLYSRAKTLQYSDHDVCALCQAVKY
ncbi:uncharacterized protein LOC129227498 isoform X3 [Uloborus diversus]|uniref:uncharacterized protein LOC129227498 isoform X3 n=1 Tax=Uloborus diversus TaxID=327109 RepID=UPI0024096AB1|nr:uncharacterized protein LOC129227498 isoform X3 [Uloborus diversus]